MYTFINDRSDLDAIIAINPKAPEGERQITRRQELLDGRHLRNDVVLLSGTRTERQYALYVTPTGYEGDVWILDVLSDAQYAEVEGIAERMRKNALEFPPASTLLGQ